MYEYIEDVTANLGEKLTGYKKANRMSPNSVFNKIIKESNVQSNNTSDAILRIQEAVDVRLMKEAKLAAKNENTIRELEAEIKQMSAILSDKQSVDLHDAYKKILEEKFMTREVEMAEACVTALKTPPDVDILNVPNIVMNSNHLSDSEGSVQLVENDIKDRSPSPVLMPTNSSKPVLNYAAALKNNSAVASTSVSTIQSSCVIINLYSLLITYRYNLTHLNLQKTNIFTEDLISFDVEEKHVKKPIILNEDVKCLGDSSPEY